MATVDRIKNQLSALAGTRWVVIAGVAAGIGIFVASLLGGSRLVPAFFLGLAANGVVIGIAGVTRQVWKGAEVSSAPIPGGGALDVEAVGTVQQGLADLNKRTDAHTEAVNKRLYDLEKRVFKASSEGNDEEE